jgi:hypothetical protein
MVTLHRMVSLVVAAAAVGVAAVGLTPPAVAADEAPSDARLKRDVEELPPARGLELVMALEPVRYSWAEGEVVFSQGGREIGLIAQEVVEVLPEAVEDRGGFLYVGYDQVTALLVAATQRQQELLVEQAALLEEQQMEIDELRSRIDELEAELF